MTECKEAQLNEPWTVRRSSGLGPIGIFDCFGNLVFDAKYGGNWEDFDRVAACVNACAGIPYQALKDCIVTVLNPEMVADISIIKAINKYNADLLPPTIEISDFVFHAFVERVAKMPLPTLLCNKCQTSLPDAIGGSGTV